MSSELHTVFLPKSLSQLLWCSHELLYPYSPYHQLYWRLSKIRGWDSILFFSKKYLSVRDCYVEISLLASSLTQTIQSPVHFLFLEAFLTVNCQILLLNLNFLDPKDGELNHIQEFILVKQCLVQSIITSEVPAK